MGTDLALQCILCLCVIYEVNVLFYLTHFTFICHTIFSGNDNKNYYIGVKFVHSLLSKDCMLRVFENK
jgi:hypothetical protein